VPITPADVEAQEFRVVFRGYEIQAVDAFLHQIQDDLARWIATAIPAEPAVSSGDASTAQAIGPDTKAMTRTSPSFSTRALRTLRLAEQMADQVVAHAATEADQTRARAQAEAKQVQVEAQAEVARAEAEMQLRHYGEIVALTTHSRRLRAEVDRLSQLESRCHEDLQAWLAKQQLQLNQRLSVEKTWEPPGSPTPPISPDALVPLSINSPIRPADR
jgi:DivIVA domain-containing protein